MMFLTYFKAKFPQNSHRYVAIFSASFSQAHNYFKYLYFKILNNIFRMIITHEIDYFI